MSPARIDTPLGRILTQEGRKQAWLAEQVGVSTTAVWAWVHGIYDPEDDATKLRVAEALGRKVDELYPEVAA